MLKIEKKQVKVISIAIVAAFVLGIVGLAVSSNPGKAIAAGSSSNVGIVNMQQVMSQHPDMAGLSATMKAEVEQAQKDFDSKAANMQDKEKQEYYLQLQQRLSNKQQELLTTLNDKVVAAVKAVADSKGLTVILDKNAVVYGGQDITDDVIKKITGK